jgi:predicted methyltransferase
MLRAMCSVAIVTVALLSGSGAASAASVPPYIQAAVDDSARPDADKQRDADRKPGETLAFAGVKPGATVVELAPGGGYYTRLLSQVVGPKGKVYAIVSPPKPDAPAGAPVPGAAVRAIAADPHYGNIEVVTGKVAELTVPTKADLVWTSQNYHDFHNIKDVDIATINGKVADVLKPGGIYFVLDHSAEAGSGARDTDTLHRIDRDQVVKEVTAAKFKLVDESKLLANKDDPRTAKVFDAGIRGHTDQFMLKFRKNGSTR